MDVLAKSSLTTSRKAQIEMDRLHLSQNASVLVEQDTDFAHHCRLGCPNWHLRASCDTKGRMRSHQDADEIQRLRRQLQLAKQRLDEERSTGESLTFCTPLEKAFNHCQETQPPRDYQLLLGNQPATVPTVTPNCLFATAYGAIWMKKCCGFS